jgi:hypothetical protein
VKENQREADEKGGGLYRPCTFLVEFGGEYLVKEVRYKMKHVMI